jgi:hypothetical protein
MEGMMLTIMTIDGEGEDFSMTFLLLRDVHFLYSLLLFVSGLTEIIIYVCSKSDTSCF